MVQAITRCRPIYGIGKSLGLQRPAALQAGRLSRWESVPPLQCFLIPAKDHIELPLSGEPVPITDHLGDLIICVNVNEGDRDVAEEGFTRQPQQDRAVLADRPEHADLLELTVGFTEEIYRFILELIDMFHLYIIA